MLATFIRYSRSTVVGVGSTTDRRRPSLWVLASTCVVVGASWSDPGIVCPVPFGPCFYIRPVLGGVVHGGLEVALKSALLGGCTLRSALA